MRVAVAIAVSPRCSGAVQIGIVKRPIVVVRTIQQPFVVLEQGAEHVSGKYGIPGPPKRGIEAEVPFHYPILGHPDNHRVLRDVVNHVIPNREPGEFPLVPRAFIGVCTSLKVTMNKGNPLVDRKSTRLNSSHVRISYAVFCLKKKTTT